MYANLAYKRTRTATARPWLRQRAGKADCEQHTENRVLLRRLEVAVPARPAARPPRPPPPRRRRRGGGHVVDDGRSVYVPPVVVCRPHDATTTPMPVPARGRSRPHGRSAWWRPSSSPWRPPWSRPRCMAVRRPPTSILSATDSSRSSLGGHNHRWHAVLMLWDTSGAVLAD